MLPRRAWQLREYFHARKCACITISESLGTYMTIVRLASDLYEQVSNISMICMLEWVSVKPKWSTWQSLDRDGTSSHLQNNVYLKCLNTQNRVIRRTISPICGKYHCKNSCFPVLPVWIQLFHYIFSFWSNAVLL